MFSPLPILRLGLGEVGSWVALVLFISGNGFAKIRLFMVQRPQMSKMSRMSVNVRIAGYLKMRTFRTFSGWRLLGPIYFVVKVRFLVGFPCFVGRYQYYRTRFAHLTRRPESPHL